MTLRGMVTTKHLREGDTECPMHRQDRDQSWGFRRRKRMVSAFAFSDVRPHEQRTATRTRDRSFYGDALVVAASGENRLCALGCETGHARPRADWPPESSAEK